MHEHIEPISQLTENLDDRGRFWETLKKSKIVSVKFTSSEIKKNNNNNKIKRISTLSSFSVGDQSLLIHFASNVVIRNQDA